MNKNPSNKPLIIAGSGRSGTTWVLDEIANANNMLPVFEPLHYSVAEAADRYANAYLPVGIEDEPFYQFVNNVLCGRCKTIWTKYRIVPDRLIPRPGYFRSYQSLKELYRRYRSLVRNMRDYHSRRTEGGVAVKLIRANLMVEWLAENYDCSILFVIRHPGAVIESKNRLDSVSRTSRSLYGKNDWDPFPILESYCRDELLRKDLIDKYMPELELSKLSSIEAQTIVWCIENAPVLHKHSNSRIHLSCYEWLADEKSEEWCKVSEKFGLQAPAISSALEKPSQQASPDFRLASSLEQKLSRWQSRLGDEDQLAMQSILDRFQIEAYRMDHAWPVISPPSRDNSIS